MGKVRIAADSTSDLSPEQIERYGIQIIPLCIQLGDKSYYDKEQILPDQIYEWSDAHKTTPKTAAPSIELAIERLKPYVENKEDVVFLGISEDMSTTCNVIRLAAQELDYDRIFVIDSRNLSTGIGLQVIRAAVLAEEGKTAEEIVSEIESLRDDVRASFIVDTLTYLARGGRCTATTALLGNTLKLHPRIDVTSGKMGVSQKYRGNLKSVTLKYVKDMEEKLLNCRHDLVFITHSGTDEDIIEEVKAYLTGLGVFKEIVVTRAGGVVSSHCGWGTLGVLFYMK